MLFIRLVPHYLNDAFTIGLETKLGDDRELDLSAEGEHNLKITRIFFKKINMLKNYLLVSDHTVACLLLCKTDPRWLWKIK